MDGHLEDVDLGEIAPTDTSAAQKSRAWRRHSAARCFTSVALGLGTRLLFRESGCKPSYDASNQLIETRRAHCRAKRLKLGRQKTAERVIY